MFAERVRDYFLKGRCHDIFCFWFFSWISFTPAPEYSIKTIRIFFQNSRRYSQVKVHHWYQQHWWQVATGVSDTSGKIVGGINNTSGKFATGIIDTSGKFFNQFVSVVNTGGKFAGVNDTGGKLPPVSTTPAANLPPV